MSANEVTKLRTRLERRETQMKTLAETYKSTTQELRNTTEDYHKSLSCVIKLQGENAALQHMYDSACTTIVRANAEMEKANSKLDELRRDLIRMQDKYSAAKEKLEEMDLQVRTTEAWKEGYISSFLEAQKYAPAQNSSTRGQSAINSSQRAVHTVPSSSHSSSGVKDTSSPHTERGSRGESSQAPKRKRRHSSRQHERQDSRASRVDQRDVSSPLPNELFPQHDSRPSHVANNDASSTNTSDSENVIYEMSILNTPIERAPSRLGQDRLTLQDASVARKATGYASPTEAHDYMDSLPAHPPHQTCEQEEECISTPVADSKSRNSGHLNATGDTHLDVFPTLANSHPNPIPPVSPHPSNSASAIQSDYHHSNHFSNNQLDSQIAQALSQEEEWGQSSATDHPEGYLFHGDEKNSMTAGPSTEKAGLTGGLAGFWKNLHGPGHGLQRKK